MQARLTGVHRLFMLARSPRRGRFGSSFLLKACKISQLKQSASLSSAATDGDTAPENSSGHGRERSTRSDASVSEERDGGDPVNFSKYPKVTPERYARLSALSSPGFTTDAERRKLIDEIVRIDHAGEYGAVRIYEGQSWGLKARGDSDDRTAGLLQHMKEQEYEHLEALQGLIADRRARPTALLPLWHVAGFALGAGTAILGRKAAMACTVAVEEAIGEHYNDQIRELLQRGYDEEELCEVLQINRDEELEHHDTALEEGAEYAPGFDFLKQTIKAGCKVAIEVTKRV